MVDYSQRSGWLVNVDVEWPGEGCVFSEQDWDASPPRLWRLGASTAREFAPAQYVRLDLVQLIDESHCPAPGDHWDRSRVKIYDTSTVDRNMSPTRMHVLNRYDRDRKATLIRTPRAYRPTGWIDVPQVATKARAIELVGVICALDLSAHLPRITMMTDEEDEALLGLAAGFAMIQRSTDTPAREGAANAVAHTIADYAIRFLGTTISPSQVQRTVSALMDS